MGWLIFLAILIGLGCLPLGVRLRYDEDGPLAAVLLGRLPIVLYPVPGWLKKLTSREKKPGENKPKEEKPKKKSPKRLLKTPRAAPGKSSCPWCSWASIFWGISAESCG